MRVHVDEMAGITCDLGRFEGCCPVQLYPVAIPWPTFSCRVVTRSVGLMGHCPFDGESPAGGAAMAVLRRCLGILMILLNESVTWMQQHTVCIESCIHICR